MASTLSQLQQTSQAGQSWGALKEPVLRECASVLLTHVVKLLCVYVHIIEERDPEAKEKVNHMFMGFSVLLYKPAACVYRDCPCLLFLQERVQVMAHLQEDRSLRF